MERHTLKYNLAMGGGYEDVSLKQAIDIIKNKNFKRIKVPDNIHFVWIGDLYCADISYIKVWSDINKDKSLFLWIDSSSSFIKWFQRALKSYCDSDSGKKDILKLQNDAFKYIWHKIKNGVGFNDAAHEFLKNINIEDVGCDSYSNKEISDRIKIMDIQELFDVEFSEYKKFYYYELILRGNLACASDVIRILILYKYGGVYIDIDTLPYLESIYQKTNALLDKLDIRHDENVYLAKSHAFLCKFNYENEALMNFNDYLKKIKYVSDVDISDISDALISDINNSEVHQLPALGDIYVYDGLISISTVAFIGGVFFNNIIASAPCSRFLKTLLKRVAFNYHYIERHNKIFEGNFVVSSLQDRSTTFSFLLNYRHDVISKNEFVTFYLSGPRLVSNTIYRVICKLTGLHRILSTEKLAKLMQNDDLGVGFQKQTLDTPLGIKSSWRTRNE
ncbi:TcdA/TcdB catalytic glycosyltransferase domain-containing protein [Serratia sp. root2]|uniref:TcdA/TcdB catalytic glycosyltransferase domain-containing protein n=1 Tax=Serratia sp. root2 TaxID=3059676 RepID=UPI00288ED96E|nr:TcdA/TcdB catalytic glycosyltransferase domain-containing protein [Serratia sp. root2]MDT3253213.1 TcdA/TcdB catalytic glycosyltransferase domain-containing protein [Serratia sp. root2]